MVEEVRAVPAFAAILGALDAQAFVRGASASQSSEVLAKVARASPGEQEAYLAELGFHVLSCLRHVESHMFFAAFITERGSPTSGIIGDAVHESAKAIAGVNAAFTFDHAGWLVYTKSAESQAVTGVRSVRRAPRGA